jgi:amino acid transporter
MQTKSKKLSFFATMLFSAGSCIGAGIFFKNATILGNNGGSIVGVILS